MPFLSDDVSIPEITRIGVIGTGVMGSMMTLLLAEHADIDVSIYDRSEESMQRTIEKAQEANLEHKVHLCRDIESLCQSLGSPKVFLFSLPHGGPGDGVVKTLTPYLSKGDIVIDGSNENYTVTQKRQGWLQSRGVSYIGMGVSGGFSGARNGPSLMPGGDEKALDLLIPFLKKIAARDDQGRPCVAKIGSGGSGHYVKMIHNGIEHGIMSALCEAWGLMDNCLNMNGDEIGAVFDSWNKKGELVSQQPHHIPTHTNTDISSERQLPSRHQRSNMPNEKQQRHRLPPPRNPRHSCPRRQRLRRNWRMGQFGSNLSTRPHTESLSSTLPPPSLSKLLTTIINQPNLQHLKTKHNKTNPNRTIHLPGGPPQSRLRRRPKLLHPRPRPPSTHVPPRRLGHQPRRSRPHLASRLHHQIRFHRRSLRAPLLQISRSTPPPQHRDLRRGRAVLGCYQDYRAPGY